MRITRREFVAAATATATAPRPFALAPSARKTVLVVGAGLAGLNAALRLTARGFDVTLIEARDRVGGRLHTRRDFKDAQWLDAGAQGGADSYKRLVAIAKDLNLRVATPLRATAPPELLLHMKGRTFRSGELAKDPSLNPYDLPDELKRVAPPLLASRYVGPVAARVEDRAAWIRPEWSAYDKKSLRVFLEESGAPPGAIDLISRSPNCNSIDTASALWAIRDAARFRLAGANLQLSAAGGMDRVTQAMAAGLEGKIKLGLTLKKVTITAGGVRASVSPSGGSGDAGQIEAAHIVLAIPFSVLRDIDIGADLSEGKRRAIRELPYTQISKVYLQTKTRYFEALGLGNVLWTDTPIERVFASTPRESTSPRGLLHVWMDGESAIAIDKMAEADRIPFVVDTLDRILPGTKDNVETAYFHSWGLDPYAKGAYCHFGVGQAAALHPHIAHPEGRLHFAGEHTTTVEPGMEAALESGERVTAEIAEA